MAETKSLRNQLLRCSSLLGLVLKFPRRVVVDERNRGALYANNETNLGEPS